MLDPRRLLRWIYIARMSVASAIFLAAIWSVWLAGSTDRGALPVASVAFAITTLATVMSAVYTEVYRRPLGTTFLYLQSLFDLLLVTTIVHATSESQANLSLFAALYILVIAASSLLLPVGGGLLIAALGNVLYFADAVWLLGGAVTYSVWLQLGVFALVALGSAYLSAQLQRAGAGKDILVAELEHTRLQAEEILRNIRSGVLTVDSGGRLLFANPMAEQLLGLDLLERLGEPILEHIGTTAPELATALLRSVRERTRITRAEGIVSTVAKRFPVGVTTTYTEGDGATTDRTATAIFQDISDQKRMDALRLRAERLEGVAELSASLAHEIKNPLASIRSAVEQLARMPKATQDERTLGDLVLRESDRLSRLLSDFLDFARLHVARTKAVDIGELAMGAMRLVQSHPDRRTDVRVNCVAYPGASLLVDADEDLLHRALFNLLLNAVQASPPGGEVRIDVAPDAFEPLPVGIDFPGGAVAVRIADEGSGIPAEIRDRMFDPFFTTKPGGSGLGLSVVHRAIEAHRGVVFVDSSTRGTRFTVVLPRVQSPNGSPT